MDLTVFIAPVITGVFSGAGAGFAVVVSLRSDVGWLKEITQQLGKKVDHLTVSVARIEGKEQ